MTLICWSQKDAFDEDVRQQLACGDDFSISQARERTELINLVQQNNPDLVVAEGVKLEDLEWYRQAVDPYGPVLLLGSIEHEEELLAEVLERGISNCIRHPVSSRLLTAKVNSMLRARKSGSPRHTVARFNLVVDDQRHQIEIGGHAVHLTLTEFKILKELASEQDRVVPRQEIQTRVFGMEKPAARSLDVHVCAVRKKLRPHGLDVESVRGVGYRLSSCAN